MNWTAPTPSAEVNFRAGGRRRYNRLKQLEALRRQEAALNMADSGYSRAAIARALGVCRFSVWRYLNIGPIFDSSAMLNQPSRIRRPHSIKYDSRRPLGYRWRVRPYK